jgi:adenosylhomocysteine nucleosidase
MMQPALGFVTASVAEAHFVLGCRQWTHVGGRSVWRSRDPHGVELFAVRSGRGLESALSAARWLVREGVTALVCVGVAGGLHPGLRPGQLVLCEKVVEDQGAGKGSGAWEADGFGTELAYTTLSAHGIRIRKGTVVTTKTAVLSARQKSLLYRKTQGLAVDMESAAVARAAAESNLPFLALRAVCDPQERTLDRGLADCLDQGGRIQFFVLLKNLLLKPSLVSDLPPLTRDFALALSALRRAWQVLLRNNLPLLLAAGTPAEKHLS